MVLRRRIIGPSFSYVSVPPATAPAGPVLDTATIAWVSAVTTAGGTVSSNQQDRVNTLIGALKTASIFAKLDRLWLFAGESVAQQTTIDIINLGTNTVNNSPTLGATGYVGNASNSYISSGFIPATAGGNYTASSCMVGVYIQSRTTVEGWDALGHSGASGETRLIQKAAHLGGPTFFELQTYPPSNGVSGTPANAGGCWVLSRIGSAQAVYVNGNTTPWESNSQAPLALDNVSIYFMAANFNGTTNSPSGDTFSAGFIGGGLTAAEVSDLSTALNTYMTAWGVNFY